MSGANAATEHTRSPSQQHISWSRSYNKTCLELHSTGRAWSNAQQSKLAPQRITLYHYLQYTATCFIHPFLGLQPPYDESSARDALISGMENAAFTMIPLNREDSFPVLCKT
jgi:hypothetical protein